MRTSEIDLHRKQRLFVPFRLCMSDGTSFDVLHPENILVSRTVIAVAVKKTKLRADRAGAIVFCDPVHIIRIEPTGNGTTSRRRTSR